MRATPLLLLALGCRNKYVPEEADTTPLSEDTIDLDGDGYGAADDCDDESGAVHPGAAEICDGLDNDCDGTADDGVLQTFYADSDDDGFGDAAIPAEACSQQEGFVPIANDCDDADGGVYPGAPEACDSLDNDCDGSIDEDVTTAWYADADGDGFGDPGAAADTCDPDQGYVADNTDCDDTDAASFPGGEEVCDEADNDCDGPTDEGVGSTWYPDIDGDGYGDESAPAESCVPLTGYAEAAGDCDDADAAYHPGAAEDCSDPSDYNCDGSVAYADSDGDGYAACEECDDADALVNPSAAEVCNGLDDDCDGLADDADGDLDLSTGAAFYADSDADGYGDGGAALLACEQPAGYAEDAADCDDGEPGINPAASEVCDGADNDCDGDADEGSALDAPAWYGDGDGDGYGLDSDALASCDQPEGYSADGGDCDDEGDASYPGAPELYDGLDNDCDGQADEDLWRGTGRDGALIVTGVTDLSADTSNGRAAPDAVAYPVAAVSGATITLTEAAIGLAAGDEVLIGNLHGSDAAHGSVGAYEFATVDVVSGSEVTLVLPVAALLGEADNADLAGQAVFLQRIPHYSDVSVAAGALLTSGPWDGERYGVVAFRASGAVTVADGGSIAADELGYWGGETGTCLNCDAYQGESYAGEGEGDYPGGPYNEANGAWAANYGGGGANVTGGGGEHGGGAAAGDSWTGGSATPPSAGATYGAADLSALFLGSGGGGVWHGGYDTPGEDPGPGGDGGGIVLIGAGSFSAAGAGAVSAIGGSPTHWASGTWTYGAGGGAGGTIWLIAEDLTLASGAVDASGGLGESSHIRAGGDGGQGRVRVDFASLGGFGWGSAEAAALLLDAAPQAGWSETP